MHQEAWPYTADKLHTAQHDAAVVVTLQPLMGWQMSAVFVRAGATSSTQQIMLWHVSWRCLPLEDEFSACWS